MFDCSTFLLVTMMVPSLCTYTVCCQNFLSLSKTKKAIPKTLEMKKNNSEGGSGEDEEREENKGE